jgi:hypothetical protein
VEAWSRYPSHARELRTGSANHEDNVKTRDFTFKVNSAQITDHENDQMRTPTNKKKRATPSGISKSSSMTFGKFFFQRLHQVISLSKCRVSKAQTWPSLIHRDGRITGLSRVGGPA